MKKKEHEFLGVYTSFYKNSDMTICNFFDVNVFIM